MRQVISTTLVAVIVGALAGATMSAVAQAPAEQAITPAAGINAASVDGKSAVGYTNKRNARKGKLVATNKAGELPSNIVRPYWGYLKNKPGILADDQIGWNELQGIPAGFADGVDAGDTTTSYIAATSGLTAVGGSATLVVTYPVTRDLEVSVFPEGGGTWATTMASPAANYGDEIIYRTGATITRWLYFKNYIGSADRLKARITVWDENRVAPAALKGQIEATFYKGKKLPRP
jgi:hypothetical protein